MRHPRDKEQLHVQSLGSFICHHISCFRLWVRIELVLWPRGCYFSLIWLFRRMRRRFGWVWLNRPSAVDSINMHQSRATVKKGSGKKTNLSSTQFQGAPGRISINLQEDILKNTLHTNDGHVKKTNKTTTGCRRRHGLSFHGASSLSDIMVCICSCKDPCSAASSAQWMWVWKTWLKQHWQWSNTYGAMELCFKRINQIRSDMMIPSYNS